MIDIKPAWLCWRCALHITKKHAVPSLAATILSFRADTTELFSKRCLWKACHTVHSRLQMTNPRTPQCTPLGQKYAHFSPKVVYCLKLDRYIVGFVILFYRTVSWPRFPIGWWYPLYNYLMQIQDFLFTTWCKYRIFYLLNGWMSYQKISWSLENEDSGSDFTKRSEIGQASVLQRSLSNVRAIRS